MGRQGFSQGLPRSQTPKDKQSVSQAFTMYRPLAYESACEVYELLRQVQVEGLLPDHAEIRSPSDMRVTFLERRKLTKKLQGMTAGFSAARAIHEINETCDSSDDHLIVSLGRVTLMNNRQENAVAHLEHDQIIASEYGVIKDALTHLKIKGMHKERFRPHVGLVRVPGATGEDKEFLARELSQVVPKEVALLPLTAFPKR